MKFVIGLVVASSDVAREMNRNKQFNSFVRVSIGRYKNLDWGDSDETMRSDNDRSINDGGEIRAKYVSRKAKQVIWISTNKERTKTTIEM